MKELQEFLKQYQKEMNWEIKDRDFEQTQVSLLNNYMLLTTEVSEIAEELRALFNSTQKESAEKEIELEAAFAEEKKKYKENIGKEIADCFAYLVKFANYFEIDLEESFYGKMEEVKNRTNKDF